MEQALFGNHTMQYLIAIRNCGNLTKAAQALYISQPALSKFLATLESRLGFALFSRIGRTLILTYEGERFMHYASEICNLEQQLAYEIGSLKDRRGGRLRLAVPLLRSAYVLPKVLPPFLKIYPDVTITVMEEHSNMLESLILDNKVDFALVNFEAKHPNIAQHHIRHDRILVAVPATHKIAQMYGAPPGIYPEIDVALLKDERFVLQHRGQQTREVAEKIFESAGFTPNILLNTRSLQTAINLVAEGVGACFLAELYLHSTVGLPLAVFSVKNKYPPITMNLAYQKKIYMPQYFKDFISIVKETL